MKKTRGPRLNPRSSFSVEDLRGLLPDRSRPATPDPQIRARGVRRLGVVAATIAIGYVLLSARATTLMLLPDPRLEGKARVQFEASVEVHGKLAGKPKRPAALH